VQTATGTLGGPNVGRRADLAISLGMAAAMPMPRPGLTYRAGPRWLPPA
jgi:hypothetical protein